MCHSFISIIFKVTFPLYHCLYSAVFVKLLSFLSQPFMFPNVSIYLSQLICLSSPMPLSFFCLFSSPLPVRFLAYVWLYLYNILLLTNETTTLPQAAVHQGHGSWGSSQSKDTKAFSQPTVHQCSAFFFYPSCLDQLCTECQLHNADTDLQYHFSGIFVVNMLITTQSESICHKYTCINTS